MTNSATPGDLYYTGVATVYGTPTPGWDFKDVWGFSSGVNENYPVLSSLTGTVGTIEGPLPAKVGAGGTAVFSVQTTTDPIGVPVRYQWQTSTNGVTWADIAGAEGSALVIPNVALSDSESLYRCVVSAGIGSSTSATAKLTVGYSATLTSRTGYTLTAQPGSSSPVTPGGSFTFVFTHMEGYAGGTVHVNGSPVTLDGDGRSTITDITSEQTVTVAGVMRITYAVTLTSGTGYTLAAESGSSSPVAHGGSFTFRFVRYTGYSGGTVYVNGSAVTLDGEGRYTITNITSEQTVTVTDLVRITYAVTLTSGTGYTLTAESGSSSPVPHGESFTFVFTHMDGYARGTVRVNGSTAMSDGNDRYTISNITSEQTVMVTGITRVYAVTLASGTGYTLTAQSSSSPVPEGGSFTFIFRHVSGYSHGTVYVNGSPVTLDQYGRYTITNITSEQTVTVSGVTLSGTTPGGTIGNNDALSSFSAIFSALITVLTAVIGIIFIAAIITIIYLLLSGRRY
jgi:hypothetical protein